VVADCSTLQPQKTRGHRELMDGLVVRASTKSRQSADGDEQQPLMSAAACQPDTPVQCRAHSGMPEHTARTKFAPGRVAIAAPEAVESCGLTFDVSRRGAAAFSTDEMGTYLSSGIAAVERRREVAHRSRMLQQLR